MKSLSSFVVGLLERSMEDGMVIRRRKRALAQLRRRRQPLPPEAPDSVEILKQIRSQVPHLANLEGSAFD